MISRPLNVVIAMATTFLSAKMLALNNNVLLLQMMTVVASTVFIGNAINDLFDYEVDRINRPDRPFASGNITLPALISTLIIVFGINMFVLVSLNLMAICFCLCLVYPTIIMYTPLFKPTPLIGNIIISCILGFVFLFVDICINQ